MSDRQHKGNPARVDYGPADFMPSPSNRRPHVPPGTRISCARRSVCFIKVLRQYPRVPLGDAPFGQLRIRGVHSPSRGDILETGSSLRQARSALLLRMERARRSASKKRYVDFFIALSRLGLVGAEWTHRKNARFKCALREAKLKIGQACIEDVDYPAKRELDKAVVRQLASCRCIQEHQSILITGATGVGESYLACALAHRACRT
jgi:hypothetical protein